jgi:hypothetical protein
MDVAVPDHTVNEGGKGWLIAAVVVISVVWGGAAATSWYSYLTASSWWATAGMGGAALRAADRRLFLEDALVVSLLTVLALAAIVVCYSRRRMWASPIAWMIALVGMAAWLLGPVAAPRLDQVMERCVPTPQYGDGTGADVRGYSWTRFGLIIVRRDMPPVETTCR